MTPKTPSAVFETTATEGTIYSDVRVKNPFDLKGIMLLKPRNKAEFVSQIMALPPEQRKVVVLAGRHLNEGSRNIAVRNHLAWGRHGAVTVLIPAAWTPHGFWREMEKTARVKETTIWKLFHTVRKRADKVPRDNDLIHALQRNHLQVPVVNLHGTPKRNYGLFINTRSEAPEWLKEAAGWAWSVGYLDVIFEPKTHRDMAAHPMEVLVEYDFKGKGRAKRLKTGDKLVAHRQLESGYLNNPRITRKELDLFEKRFTPTLNQLIQTIARAAKERKT